MSQPPLRPAARWARYATLCLHVAGLSTLAGLTTLIPSVVQAQEAPVSLRLPAQSLDAALIQLGRQTPLQFFYTPATVANLTAPALDGSFTPEQALRQLLQGSPVRYHREGNSITLTRQLEGQSQMLAPVEVNARLDPLATEGTGSYQSTHVGMAKGQTLREIPQSISVVTQQQIEDQGLTSLGAVLEHTPGVTVTSGPYGEPESFHARGLAITSVQVDGTAVGGYSRKAFSPNLAMYDHVEVLRGADGLFSGTGEAGGTVNLVRKRALAERQLRVAATAGRWNDYRGELDLTGALDDAGRWRARLVGSWHRHDKFYDVARGDNRFVYGVLETDLTPTTLLSLGMSHERRDDIFGGGVPAYSDGGDIGLPRHTSFIGANTWLRSHNTESFLSAEQALGSDWRLKASVTHIRRVYDSGGPIAQGAIDRVTGQGFVQQPWQSQMDVSTRALAYDVHLRGDFALLGGEHQLLLGMDGQRSKVHEIQYEGVFDAAMPYPVDIFNFDPATSLLDPIALEGDDSNPDSSTRQHGFYGRLKLQLAEPLHLVLGGRYASFERQGGVHYKERGIFTPFAGLVYDLSSQWTAYASLAEIHQSQADRLRGPLPGTPLDPVRGRSVELGVKGLLFDERLNTALALYRVERTGEAFQIENGGRLDNGSRCCFEARGKVISQGVDTEISGNLLPALKVTAGYTFNRNRDKTAGGVPYSTITPKHLFKLWATYTLPQDGQRWTVGGGVTAQSRYYTQVGTARLTQSGYAVWNGFLQYQVTPDWQVALNIDNLFDRRYYETLRHTVGYNFYGEPRNVRVSVRGRF